MKKEILAFILLLIIFAASLLNTYKLTQLTEELSEYVENCRLEASNDNWEGSAKNIEDAIKIWNSKELYTHIVLRHCDIDSMTEDFYNLMSSVYQNDLGETTAYSKMVETHLKSISKMESIRLGSIF